jgi:hypothetical protein
MIDTDRRKILALGRFFQDVTGLPVFRSQRQTGIAPEIRKSIA